MVKTRKGTLLSDAPAPVLEPTHRTDPGFLWPKDRDSLFSLGEARCEDFCRENGVAINPATIVPRNDWYVGSCAYWRPDEGTRICLEHCGYPCGEVVSRNWTWPGSVTDREPFGVMCHELGHYFDFMNSEKKGRYWGDFSEKIMKRSGEPKLTSYAPNHAEWFAEMFRLFVANPDLLRFVRPKTYKILSEIFRPLEVGSWRGVLGTNVPERVVSSLRKKGATD